MSKIENTQPMSAERFLDWVRREYPVMKNPIMLNYGDELTSENMKGIDCCKIVEAYVTHRHASLIAERDAILQAVGFSNAATRKERAECDSAWQAQYDAMKQRAEAAERDLREARLPINAKIETHCYAPERDEWRVTLTVGEVEISEGRQGQESAERFAAKLKAALRRLQGGEWVSVKERYPTTKGVYEVYVRNCWTSVDVYSFNPERPEDWKNVTHWRLLPTPPTAEPESRKELQK